MCAAIIQTPANYKIRDLCLGACGVSPISDLIPNANTNCSYEEILSAEQADGYRHRYTSVNGDRTAENTPHQEVAQQERACVRSECEAASKQLSAECRVRGGARNSKYVFNFSTWLNLNGTDYTQQVSLWETGPGCWRWHDAPPAITLMEHFESPWWGESNEVNHVIIQDWLRAWEGGGGGGAELLSWSP